MERREDDHGAQTCGVRRGRIADGAAGFQRLRAGAGRFLPRQNHRDLHQCQRRRRLRPLRTHGRPPSWQAHSRQSDHLPKEHGRCWRHAARQLALQCRCQGWHRARAVARATAFEPLLGNKSAQYDGRRFNYIGSANDEVSVCVAWHTSGVRTFEDAKKTQLVVGANGTSEDTYQYPALLNHMFGSRFKMVSGYPGGNDINLAMERGEVQGRCSIPWSTVKATRKFWIDEKKVNLLMQYSLSKHVDLPDVPLIMDLAKTDEQRNILKLIFGRQVMGRPFAAPPDLPRDRVAMLRKAFMDTMADADFLAEAEKAKFEVTPVSGEKIESLVLDVYRNTTPELAEKAGAAMR